MDANFHARLASSPSRVHSSDIIILADDGDGGDVEVATFVVPSSSSSSSSNVEIQGEDHWISLSQIQENTEKATSILQMNDGNFTIDDISPFTYSEVARATGAKSRDLRRPATHEAALSHIGTTQSTPEEVKTESCLQNVLSKVFAAEPVTAEEHQVILFKKKTRFSASSL